jgi:diaminopimelate epimerase
MLVETEGDAMTGEFDVGAPTLRVAVYERGELRAQVACETAQEAAEVVAEWEEHDGVECEVEDLAGHHLPTDVLTPEPEDGL